MENESYFPLFVSLKGKRILLAGAGKVAARRAGVLLSFGASLYVVAPERSKEMEELCQNAPSEKLMYQKRRFNEQDLDEKDMVLAATDDPALNRKICLLCRQKGILANNASSKEDCDFFFPAILKQDGLTIGISSGGNDHRKVAAVCDKLRETNRAVPCARL